MAGVSSLSVRASQLSLSSVFPVVLLLGLLGMTARPATDPDLWWHLRTGQWIVETGHIPHTDPFSFTRAGQTWVSHEWLSEVVFYELWNHAGAAALIVFSAVVTATGFMLLYWRCLLGRVDKHWAAAATAFGAWAAAPSWGIRPQMFTFVLASLLLWLIERGETRPRLLFWIPPLFLLWLNLHAGFALGPALLLAYGVGLLWETAAGSTPWQQARPIFVRVLVLLLACLALVPFNPSGAELYRYPFDTLRSVGMRSFIVEWFSPNFHDGMYRPFLLAWLLVLIALGRPRSRPRGRVIAPLVLTSLAALDAVRLIPIFVLVAMPVIAAALPARQSDHDDRRHGAPISLKFRPIFSLAVVVLMALLALVKSTSLARSQGASEAALFPEKAVAFLRASGQADGRAHDSAQRIFVYYDWGGYAVWKLYPEARVFVDGRADLYGDDLLRQFKNAVQLRDSWRDILDRWHVEAVLVPPSCALVQALLLDPEWHTEFRDSQAIMLVRNAARTGPVAARAGVSRGPRVTGQKAEKMFPRAIANLRN